MEFDLSKPQKLLQKSARDFFNRACPAKRVRELMATDTALHPELWSEVAEQGWLGIHLSEAAGGLGLGLVDLAVIAEEMGRACLPGPFLGTVWAATLIAEANATSKYLLPLAAGESKGAVALLEPDASWDPSDVQMQASKAGGGFQITGRKCFVSDAAVADVIVCACPFGAGPDLACRSGEVRRRVYPPDRGLGSNAQALRCHVRRRARRGRRRARRRRCSPCGADADLDASRRLVACADMLGGMQWIIEDTVEYAKTRQQFGKVIGSFQAVQHMCDDMLLWTESTARRFISRLGRSMPNRQARIVPSRPRRFTPPTHHAKWPTAACKFTAASASRGSTTCSCITSDPRPRKSSSATPTTIGPNWPIWSSAPRAAERSPRTWR